MSRGLYFSWASIIFLCAIFLFSVGKLPMPQIPESSDVSLGSAPPSDVLLTKNYLSTSGDDIGGLSTGPGIHISWGGLGKGSAATACATPLDILKLVAGRLSHLQSTPQASDTNARALIDVLGAIDVLEGTNEVSASVGPGFVKPGDSKDE